jgi:hypothetical protein
MIHTHTMTQLKTVQEPMKLVAPGSASVDNLHTVVTYDLNVPTTTQPTTPTSNPAYVVIPNTSLSYLKIVPVFKSTLTSPKFKVTGWSRAVNSSNQTVYYVPVCLFEGSVTLDGTNNITINGATDFRVAVTIAKNFGDGKIFNATTVNDTAFVLVDALGCEFVQIEFAASSAVADSANAFVGAI